MKNTEGSGSFLPAETTHPLPSIEVAGMSYVRYTNFPTESSKTPKPVHSNHVNFWSAMQETGLGRVVSEAYDGNGHPVDLSAFYIREDITPDDMVAFRQKIYGKYPEAFSPEPTIDLPVGDLETMIRSEAIAGGLIPAEREPSIDDINGTNGLA